MTDLSYHATYERALRDETRAQLITRGMWDQPIKVIRALCADGQRRTAYITGDADTFFSIPARVNVKGRTVAGYITGHDTNGQQDYAFIAYSYRKNGHMLPGIVHSS